MIRGAGRRGLLVAAVVAVSAIAPAATGRNPAVSLTVPFAGSGVLPFGTAGFYGSPTDVVVNAPVVGLATTPSGQGYWLTAADGGVFAYGDAVFQGSAGGLDLQAPVIGMVSTPDGNGYWQVALDGGVFAYGTAAFFGSTGALALNEPIVGMARTPSGLGYWLVATDGGIFAFGDAQFFGSTAATALNAPIVAMAATPTGKGYWLAASDGGVFNFGDANFFGSAAGQRLRASVADMTASADGTGYTLAGEDGSIYPFGSAVSYGSNEAVVPTPPVTHIVGTPDGHGYWLLDPDAFPTSFIHPAPSSALGSAVVAIASGEIGADPLAGVYCNPYGPCEQWCALFATWVWEHAGIAIPHYAFTGDIYQWAAQHHLARSPATPPNAGDLVLFGTGPATTSTSAHVGIVAQVWPDGAIVTVEGDAGPGPHGRENVIVNGPFLPSQSKHYNGFPVYAYAANS